MFKYFKGFIMKHPFKKTIVLLNTTDNMKNILQKGVKFSKQHNTILEILFVHEEPLFELPDIFRLKREENSLDKESIKKEINSQLLELSPNEKYAIFIYVDDTLHRLETIAKEPKETLVITPYQKEITPTLIEETSYAFWVLKEAKESYNKILLPTDLKEPTMKAINYALHIFKESRLVLVHDHRYLVDTLAIQADYLNVAPLTSPITIELNEEIKEAHKKEFENYLKEFGIEGEFIEANGEVDEDLIEYTKKNGFDLLFMYRNDEEMFSSSVLILRLMEKLEVDFFICF